MHLQDKTERRESAELKIKGKDQEVARGHSHVAALERELIRAKEITKAHVDRVGVLQEQVQDLVLGTPAGSNSTP